MTTQTQMQEVPFSKLVAGGGAINARVGGGKDGLDALAASIGAKGLIQPLIVRPYEGDKFEVIAGNRRLAAIGRLVKAKQFPRSWPVPVVVRVEDDTEALDTSLAENDVRLPMHAVDRFEVFAALVERGLSPGEIASRYGLQERQVQQCLALGRLAPEIREAWRKGKIDAKAAQAFTIEERHELQVAAFAKVRKENRGAISDYAVRRALSNDRPRASSVPAEVLQLYRDAGGRVAEDLFEAESYVEDGALLKKVRDDWLAGEVERARQDLAGRGWAWVALASDLPDAWRYGWSTVEIDQQAVPAEFTQRSEDLRQQLDNAEDAPERTRIRDELDKLANEAELACYTAEDRARSGVVIEIDAWSQTLELHYGVIRPAHVEEAPPADTAGEELEADASDDYHEEEPAPAAGEDDEDAGADISAALKQSLSEVCTLAAADAVAASPDLALRLAVAALTSRYDAPAMLRSEGMAALKADDVGDFHQAFALALAMDREALERSFAGAVSRSLDLTFNVWRYKSRDSGIAEILAAAPQDVFLASARRLFDPVDYFRRASRAVALAAIDEMREAGRAGSVAPEDVLAGMKKGELAGEAARLALECAWLPPDLRVAAYSIAGQS